MIRLETRKASAAAAHESRDVRSLCGVSARKGVCFPSRELLYHHTSLRQQHMQCAVPLYYYRPPERDGIGRKTERTALVLAGNMPLAQLDDRRTRQPF